jgi:VanZ family protein
MIIKNLLAHSKLWFALAVLWTINVTLLCLVSMKKLPSFGVSGLDKYVHFTFHFIFVILWLFYANAKQRIENKTALKVVLCSLFFGITIEILQELLTATRKADIHDVFANTLGAITAAIVFVFFHKLTKKRNTL